MHILVVDDDAKLRQAVRLMLERAGHQVTEACDGTEAIRSFRRQAADLVLCDLYMPNQDGLEVMRELRRQFSNVKIIAMSGGCGGAVDMLPAARHLGADAVLYKPFDQTAVLATIESA